MKKLTASLLSLTMVFSLLAFSGCKGRDSAKESIGTYITRGQWIAMLAEAFDLDTYQETTPYYADIDSSHQLFPHVQAAGEWNILSVYQDDMLDAGKPVTRGEAASTAAFAAGFKPKADSFDQNGQFVSQPSIDYAIERGIVEGRDFSRFMTAEECETVIALAREVYLNGSGEEKISVIYNEDLIDLSKVALNDIEAAENSVTFLNNVSGGVIRDNAGMPTALIQTEGGTAQIHVGDVFVAPPTEGQQTGAAYKVVSMEETSRGITFSTETPTLGDLYDELVLHTTLSLDESCITWADGVTVSPVSPNNLSLNGQTGTYHIEFLSSYLEEEPVTAGYLSNRTLETDSFQFHNEWKMDMGPGAEKKPNENKDNNVLAFSDALQALDFSNFTYNGIPSISDFIMPTESWTKELTKEGKYTSGHKVEGTISLDLEVTPHIEYHKWGIFGHEIQVWPESASLTVKSNIAADLQIEGSLAGKYEIGKISIPTAITGLTIDGSLSLFADLNGSIQAKVEFQNINRVEWQAPLSFRQVSEENTLTPSIQALLDLSFGPSVSLSVCAFSATIIGSDLKISGDVSATGTVEGECREYIEDGTTMWEYTESIRLQSDLYLPIISLTAYGPDCLKDTFDLEKTWDIIGKDKACHIPLRDEKYPFWSLTVKLGPDGEIIDPADALLSDLQSGDFSAFAGTYTANQEYAQNYGALFPDIVIDENGVVTGGGVTYSWGYALDYAGTLPASVVPGDDAWGAGTFQCFVSRQDGISEYYIIYPVGVSDPHSASDHPNAVRIRYVITDGGIMDMIYTKVN